MHPLLLLFDRLALADRAFVLHRLSHVHVGRQCIRFTPLYVVRFATQIARLGELLEVWDLLPRQLSELALAALEAAEEGGTEFAALRTACRQCNKPGSHDEVAESQGTRAKDPPNGSRRVWRHGAEPLEARGGGTRDGAPEGLEARGAA